MITAREVKSTIPYGAGAHTLNFAVTGSAIALFLALSTSNVQIETAPVATTLVTVACVFALTLPGRCRPFGAGLLLAGVLLLARPSLLADLYPGLVLLPATGLFLINGGLRSAQWRRYGAILALIAIAVILPAFVSRHGNLVYLLQQAITAVVVATAVLSSIASLRAIKLAIGAVAAILAWQTVAFVAAVLSDFEGSTTFIMPVGSRVNWTYTLTPLGAIAASGPGYSSEIGLRLTAWMPEPGLLAALASTVALMAFALRVPSRGLIAAVTVGVLLGSQSYAGAASLLVGLATSLILGPVGRAATITRALGWTLLAGAIWAITAAGPLGLQAKSTANAASVTDRLGGGDVLAIFSQIVSSPLGTGETGANSEINLLKSALTNGALMLLLWIAVYLVAPWLFIRDSPLLGAQMAVFVTVLFAQPPFYEIWVALTAMTIAAASAKREAGITNE